MELVVVKNSQVLGILKEIGNVFSFIYDDSINKEAYLINLNNKTNTSENLFPIFENLIPENEIIKSIKLNKDIKNEIEVLLYLDNINGSFEFYLKEEFDASILSEVFIYNYDDVIDELLQNNYTYPNILADYTLKDIKENKLHPKELDELTTRNVLGLSGVQYKFAIHLDHDKREISLTQKKNDLYFMKPYNKSRCIFTRNGNNKDYLPFMLINEHIFMTVARDFGFNIPYNAIVKGEKDYHYIIKRFDNYNGHKIDHIDFLTIIGKLSNAKYDVNINEIRNKVLPKLDNRQTLNLFKFFVFSVIIKHGDFHAKNISLISKSNDINETQFILSPFYDIATTKIYGNNTHDNDIGINITSTKKNKITKADLLHLANILNIDEITANKIIYDFTVKFLTTFKTNYIDTLPGEIRSLQFHNLNKYGHKTLEVVLNEYIKKREIELNKQFGFEIRVARFISSSTVSF